MTPTNDSVKRVESTRTALTKIPSIPQSEDGPVFNAPWEAEAFAMTLTLYEQGVFTWKEWATELSNQISLAQSRGDTDLGDTYYHHWLAALEKMVVSKKLGDAAQLTALYAAWDSAAHTTPHGQPIVLGKKTVKALTS